MSVLEGFNENEYCTLLTALGLDPEVDVVSTADLTSWGIEWIAVNGENRISKIVLSRTNFPNLTISTYPFNDFEYLTYVDVHDFGMHYVDVSNNTTIVHLDWHNDTNQQPTGSIKTTNATNLEYIDCRYGGCDGETFPDFSTNTALDTVKIGGIITEGNRYKYPINYFYGLSHATHLKTFESVAGLNIDLSSNTELEHLVVDNNYSYIDLSNFPNLKTVDIKASELKHKTYEHNEWTLYDYEDSTQDRYAKPRVTNLLKAALLNIYNNNELTNLYLDFQNNQFLVVGVDIENTTNLEVSIKRQNMLPEMSNLQVKSTSNQTYNSSLAYILRDSNNNEETTKVAFFKRIYSINNIDTNPINVTVMDINGNTLSTATISDPSAITNYTFALPSASAIVKFLSAGLPDCFAKYIVFTNQIEISSPSFRSMVVSESVCHIDSDPFAEESYYYTDTDFTYNIIPIPETFACCNLCFDFGLDFYDYVGITIANHDNFNCGYNNFISDTQDFTIDYADKFLPNVESEATSPTEYLFVSDSAYPLDYWRMLDKLLTFQWYRIDIPRYGIEQPQNPEDILSNATHSTYYVEELCISFKLKVTIQGSNLFSGNLTCTTSDVVLSDDVIAYYETNIRPIAPTWSFINAPVLRLRHQDDPTTTVGVEILPYMVSDRYTLLIDNWSQSSLTTYNASCYLTYRKTTLSDDGTSVSVNNNQLEPANPFEEKEYSWTNSVPLKWNFVYGNCVRYTRTTQNYFTDISTISEGSRPDGARKKFDVTFYMYDGDVRFRTQHDYNMHDVNAAFNYLMFNYKDICPSFNRNLVETWFNRSASGTTYTNPGFYWEVFANQGTKKYLSEFHSTSNNIVDNINLSGCQQLAQFIAFNGIGSNVNLTYCPKLLWLHIPKTRFKGIKGTINMTYLATSDFMYDTYAYSSNIKKLVDYNTLYNPIRPLQHLQGLVCNSVWVDVTNNTGLHDLIIRNDDSDNIYNRFRVDTINLTNNTHLNHVEICNGNIDHLTFSNHSELQSVFIKNCHLKSIDLSGAPNLVSLVILNNTELTSLDLSNNTKLKYLAVCNTGVTSLNLNNNTKLQVIHCYNNTNLTVLNTRNLVDLRRLNCYGNNIDVLDLSQCEYFWGSANLDATDGPSVSDPLQFTYILSVPQDYYSNLFSFNADKLYLDAKFIIFKSNMYNFIKKQYVYLYGESEAITSLPYISNDGRYLISATLLLPINALFEPLSDDTVAVTMSIMLEASSRSETSLEYTGGFLVQYSTDPTFPDTEETHTETYDLNGDTNQEVYITITGLQSNITYYFRAKATFSQSMFGLVNNTYLAAADSKYTDTVEITLNSTLRTPKVKICLDSSTDQYTDVDKRVFVGTQISSETHVRRIDGFPNTINNAKVKLSWDAVPNCGSYFIKVTANQYLETNINLNPIYFNLPQRYIWSNNAVITWEEWLYPGMYDFEITAIPSDQNHTASFPIKFHVGVTDTIDSSTYIVSQGFVAVDNTYNSFAPIASISDNYCWRITFKRDCFADTQLILNGPDAPTESKHKINKIKLLRYVYRNGALSSYSNDYMFYISDDYDSDTYHIDLPGGNCKIIVIPYSVTNNVSETFKIEASDIIDIPRYSVSKPTITEFNTLPTQIGITCSSSSNADLVLFYSTNRLSFVSTPSNYQTGNYTIVPNFTSGQVITNLRPGEKYYFGLAANLTDIAYSNIYTKNTAYSSIYEVRTPARIKLDAPTVSCVSFVNEIQVTITAVENASSYSILYKRNISNSQSFNSITLQTAGTVTIPNLLPNTAYIIKAYSHGMMDYIGTEPTITTVSTLPYIPPDTEPPTLTIIGNEITNVPVSSTYTDLGVTVTDNESTNPTLTTTILNSNGDAVNAINTQLLGNYTIIYQAVDENENSSLPKTRYVNIVLPECPIDYNESDFNKLVTFLVQPSFTDATINNGKSASNTFVASDPTTWPGVVWKLYNAKYYISNINWSYSVYNNLNGSLDLSQLSQLTSFYCSSNYLSSIDISNCNLLDTVSVSSCSSLSELNITDNSNITVLNCINNSNLTELDVTSCTQLTNLICSNNDLYQLNVSNCVRLTSLDCSENNLVNLNVTNCNLLQTIKCYDNDAITYLDLSNCAELTNASIYTSGLTDVRLNINCVNNLNINLYQTDLSASWSWTDSDSNVLGTSTATAQSNYLLTELPVTVADTTADSTLNSITFSPITLSTPVINGINATTDGIVLIFSNVVNATNYKLAYGTDASNLSTEQNYTSGDTVTGLTADQLYYFKLKATNTSDNNIADSAWSSVSTIKTLPAVTATPLATPVVSYTATDSSIILSLTDVPNASHYRVRYSLGADSLVYIYDVFYTTTYTIPNLINKSNYNVSVQACALDVNFSDSSWSSNTVVSTFIKLQPPQITLSGISSGFSYTLDNEIDLSNGYELRYSLSSTMSNSITSTVTTIGVISNLNNNTTYYVQVRSVGSINYKSTTSDWSTVASVITERSVPVSLAAPTIVDMVVNASSFTVYINGVANATGYQIQYGTSSTFTNESITDWKPNSTISSLTTGGSYYVRIRAVFGSPVQVTSAWSSVTPIQLNSLTSLNNITVSLEGAVDDKKTISKELQVENSCYTIGNIVIQSNTENVILTKNIVYQQLLYETTDVNSTKWNEIVNNNNTQLTNLNYFSLSNDILIVTETVPAGSYIIGIRIFNSDNTVSTVKAFYITVVTSLSNNFDINSDNELIVNALIPDGSYSVGLVVNEDDVNFTDSVMVSVNTRVVENRVLDAKLYNHEIYNRAVILSFDIPDGLDADAKIVWYRSTADSNDNNNSTEWVKIGVTDINNNILE